MYTCVYRQRRDHAFGLYSKKHSTSCQVHIPVRKKINNSRIFLYLSNGVYDSTFELSDKRKEVINSIRKINNLAIRRKNDYLLDSYEKVTNLIITSLNY